MRTNIDIDDTLMAEVRKRTGLPTKKAAVEEGLRLLITRANHQAILDLRGKIPWTGDLDAMRLNKQRDPLIDPDDDDPS